MSSFLRRIILNTTFPGYRQVYQRFEILALWLALTLAVELLVALVFLRKEEKLGHILLVIIVGNCLTAIVGIILYMSGGFL